MPYTIVADFRAGLDRRRTIITAPAGSLWTLTNAHITRGGEIEKRKAFASYASLPARTFGLANSASGLTVFGVDAAPSLPAGVNYQRLTHPAGVAMTRIVDWCRFRGKLYVLAAYADGNVLHFYDGVLVADFWTGGAYASVNNAVACITYKSRVIVAAGGTIIFSQLNNPALWTGTGSGTIDVFTQSENMETISALSKFQGLLAVFSRRAVQTWSIDPDISKCVLVDAADTNMGTIANRSVVPFGNIDTFLLNDTGIRSVRARDNTNRPGLYDLGSPVDPLVLSEMANLTATQLASCAATIEPVEGRYMVAIGPTIFVFSYFPASDISAWSIYDIGLNVTAWVVDGTKLYARADDTILVYGGSSGTEYDARLVTVELPFLDAGKPAHRKALTGVDATLQAATGGHWELSAGLNPSQPAQREVLARLYQPTFGELRFNAMGEGTHFGLKLTHQAPGQATIGNIIVHHDVLEAD